MFSLDSKLIAKAYRACLYTGPVELGGGEVLTFIDSKEGALAVIALKGQLYCTPRSDDEYTEAIHCGPIIAFGGTSEA